MIFLFGGSRSWAAREARRKARQVQQKKRRAFIRTTVSVFSFIILSLSLWSLLKIRHAEFSTNPATKIMKPDRRNMSNTSVKTGEPADKAKLEMPPPPLEPPSPGLMRQAYNASTVVDGKKNSTQGNDDGVVSRQMENLSTGAKMEAGHGANTEHSESVDRPSRFGEDTGGESYHSKSEDRTSSSDAAIRGMIHAETGETGNSQDEMIKKSGQRTSRMSLHDSTTDVQKQEAVDVLDAEEGGEGPTIILPERKSSSSYGGREVSKTIEESDAFQGGMAKSFLLDLIRRYETEAKRLGLLAGKRYTRGSDVGERRPSGGADYLKEERKKVDSIASTLTREAHSKQRITTGGRHYEVGQLGNRKMVGSDSIQEAIGKDHVTNQDRNDGDRIRTRTGSIDRNAVRFAANENRRAIGNHDLEKEASMTTDTRIGATGHTLKNRVAVDNVETGDSPGVVMGIDSGGAGGVNNRRQGSYVSYGDVVGSVATSSGATGSDVTGHDSGRA